MQQYCLAAALFLCALLCCSGCRKPGQSSTATGQHGIPGAQAGSAGSSRAAGDQKDKQNSAAATLPQYPEHGPANPSVLWQHSFALQFVQKIMPGPDGRIYVGLEGDPGFVSQDSNEIWDYISNDKPACIALLDKDGKEIRQVEASLSGMGKLWDDGYFAASSGPDFSIYLLAHHKRRNLLGKEVEVDGIDVTDSILCCFDPELKLKWKLKLPDSEPQSRPIPLDDGTLMLDQVVPLKSSDPQAIGERIETFSSAGKSLRQGSIEAHRSEDGDYQPGAVNPIPLGDSWIELDSGYCSARERSWVYGLDRSMKTTWIKNLELSITEPLIRLPGDEMLVITREHSHRDSDRDDDDLDVIFWRLDAGGKEIWHKTIVDYAYASCTFDEQGNLYYLERSSDGKRLPPADGTAQHIARSSKITLHSIDTQGHSKSLWQGTFSSENILAMTDRPRLDRARNFYLWIGSHIIGVSAKGKQIFDLDASAATGLRVDPLMNEMALGPDGRIYVEGSSDTYNAVLAIGDIPAH